MCWILTDNSCKLRPCVNTVQFPEQSPWWGSCRTVVKLTSLRRGPRDGRSRNLRRDHVMEQDSTVRLFNVKVLQLNLRCDHGQDLSCIWDAVQAVSLNRFIVFKFWMWFLNMVYNDWAFTLRCGISRIVGIDPWCHVWALVEDCWIPPVFLHTAVGPFRLSDADSGQGMFYLPS